MALRGVRGATRLSADDPAEMTEAVVELLTAVLERNGLTTDDVVSVVLTSTPDLRCAFPAAAAREAGFGEVPLLCAQEIDVAGALERVVRVLAHVETDRPRDEVQHIYLRGAEVLRRDIAQ
jgi:chorismate mutase